jgi:hypothetical protein
VNSSRNLTRFKAPGESTASREPKGRITPQTNQSLSLSQITMEPQTHPKPTGFIRQNSLVGIQLAKILLKFFVTMFM